MTKAEKDEALRAPTGKYVTICVECRFNNGFMLNRQSLCPKTRKTDFVTGEKDAPLCRSINTDGKCQYFQKKDDKK